MCQERMHMSCTAGIQVLPAPKAMLHTWDARIIASNVHPWTSFIGSAGSHLMAVSHPHLSMFLAGVVVMHTLMVSFLGSHMDDMMNCCHAMTTNWCLYSC